MASVLAAYLITLIVGGVFVGLSVLAGLGKDVDVDHDGDLDGVDHVEHLEHGDAGHDEGSLAEVAHAGEPGRRSSWLPFTSLRFWTFGAFFFGLTGLLLSEVAAVAEPAAMIGGLGLGVAGGAAATAVFRALRRPVGRVGDASRWVGATTELLLPLAPGGLSKVRVRAGEKDRELIATLADRHAPSLPKGARVVVLEIDAEGRARVAPESAIFTRQEARAHEEVES